MYVASDSQIFKYGHDLSCRTIFSTLARDRFNEEAASGKVSFPFADKRLITFNSLPFPLLSERFWELVAMLIGVLFADLDETAVFCGRLKVT